MHGTRCCATGAGDLWGAYSYNTSYLLQHSTCFIWCRKSKMMSFKDDPVSLMPYSPHPLDINILCNTSYWPEYPRWPHLCQQSSTPCTAQPKPFLAFSSPRTMRQQQLGTTPWLADSTTPHKSHQNQALSRLARAIKLMLSTLWGGFKRWQMWRRTTQTFWCWWRHKTATQPLDNFIIISCVLNLRVQVYHCHCAGWRGAGIALALA